MLRLVAARFAAARTPSSLPLRCRCNFHLSRPTLHLPKDIDYSTVDPRWIQKFTRDKIPRERLEIKFVRSSGPGGQNVNKVSTKVDMRFVIDDAEWLPEYIRIKLEKMEPQRINKARQFVLTSDRNRTQKANLEDCIDKLAEMISKAGEIPKEPDAAQVQRVKELKEEEKERMIRMKQRAKSKKQERRWKGDF